MKLLNKYNNYIFILIIILVCIFSVSLTTHVISEDASQQDISGSKDHPLIFRFPDSIIKYYEAKKSDE